MPSAHTKTLPLGARDVTVARLTVGGLKQVRGELLLIMNTADPQGTIPTLEEIEAMTTIVAAAAAAEDATVTREAIAAALDACDYDDGVRQLSGLFSAVIKASDLAKEDARPGEADGAADPAPLTSDASTASSPP